MTIVWRPSTPILHRPLGRWGLQALADDSCKFRHPGSHVCLAGSSHPGSAYACRVSMHVYARSHM